ncbi:MAG: hypothetical protein HY905_03240, partial [Deltaproteobacteria bacterium]|nr:hypothetical protein [Deltaproteobacteria bacterium]
RDLTTLANGGADYAPCVACHDPHGTGTVEVTRTTNRMVRDPWIDPPAPLCLGCHQ